MNVIYRKAQGADATALIKHLRCVGSETDNLSFDGDTFAISKEKEARFIEKFNNSKSDVMFVAIDGEKIVGNAIVERNRISRYNHRAEISITVLKEYWGCGVGSHLMEMMVEFAETTGIEILYLEVRSDNHRAVNLYLKYGFEAIGTYKNFFKIENSYFDAILMNKNVKKLKKIKKTP